MKYNFCTLFDSYYLTRGLVLYDSLLANCESFHLYIYAFDDSSFDKLVSLDLEHATIIPLATFETEDLLAVKKSRTIAEYCWTCTASTIWHSIKNFQLDHCTYLDADMCFFSNPSSIFSEIGNASIGITEHNFSPKLKASEIYGKYCVQFVYFKSNEIGLKALDWWRLKCIDWCYAKLEEDRYGDQKYLESFKHLFNDVCIIQELGCGIAPWNIDDFEGIENNRSEGLILSHKDGRKGKLIFYHYQGLKFTEETTFINGFPSPAPIKSEFLNEIYKPYIIYLLIKKYNLQGLEWTSKQIVFSRSLSVKMGLFFKQLLKGNKLVRFFYYQLKKNRYSRPEQIE